MKSSRFFIKTLFFSFFLSFGVFASNQWEVISEEGLFYLKNEKGNLFEIESIGGSPRFLSSGSLGENYKQLIYYAGSAGTSQIISVHRALVIDEKTNQVLGDFPYEYFSNGEKSALEQPEWQIDESKLIIKDPATDLNEKLRLD